MDELNNKLRRYIKENPELDLKLGKLQIDKTSIGQGANSLVFKGKLLNNAIAVKFFTNETQNKSKLERFRAEYLNIVLLENNYGIVKLLGYDEVTIDGMLYPLILMKKYEKHLKIYSKEIKDPVFKKKVFLKLFDFLMQVLKNIHNAGIIHRDIKPENILVLNDEFYLTDFGIAYYNPDCFSYKAETEKGEILKNYAFSAPEQNDKGVVPTNMMDIYAMGQVLQWFINDNPHNGTERIKLLGFDLHDEIVERCLNQTPEKRFKNIEEIDSFILEKQKIDPYKYAHETVQKFREVIAKTYPKKSRDWFMEFDDVKINILLNNLAEMDFKYSLSMLDNDYLEVKHIKLKRSNDGIWLLGPCNLELNWYFVQGYSESSYSEREFILIYLKSSKSFGIDESQSDYEEAYLVDDSHYITLEEADNGYAEINRKIIDLKNHKVEMRASTVPYYFLR